MEINRSNEKNSTNILILTNIDDQEKILSSLTETIQLNFNEQQSSITPMIKRRKADLTCVVCGGFATGYNFNQITCESCKAFFRRNALQPIEKTRCLKKNLNSIQCDIRYDSKYKCQRCRLLKCFQLGMRKDHILTEEEKLSKQQRLEENRRLRTRQAHPLPPTSPPTLINLSSENLLTELDWSYIHHLQLAYLSSLQSSPSSSSVLSLELAADRMLIYMNTLDIQNLTAMKLIYFLRQIEEFEQLNEHDRILLVKHNLPLLFPIHLALTFDSRRELVYEDCLNSTVSPSDEAFAQHCKSLFILCYGYEFNREFIDVLHQVSQIVHKDPIIAQLLLLIMIFSKGLSANDDQQPCLIDNQYVYHIHFKSIDLLFRYLMEKSSFNHALQQFIQITQIFIRIQRLFKDFYQYIKNTVDINYINPLMKSLLNLT